jgi:hypothetical protein
MIRCCFFCIRNLRQLVSDGNEITCFPASMVMMDNLRLVTAKNTWLLPQLAKDECSTKPPVRFHVPSSFQSLLNL